MSVTIVIPVYKSKPEEDESLSMKQTLSVLSGWDMKLIGPDGMDYHAYEAIGFKPEQILQLNSRHFSGIAAYNNMLCSRWFYDLFSDREYIMIMQNDAWVFRDELASWMDKQYDYIGAPWFWKPQVDKKRVLIDLFPLMRGRVGNGGVSLRKVKTMQRLSLIAKWIFRLTKKNEDFVWLLTDLLTFSGMRKPDAVEALKFCVEMEPEISVEKIGGQLPFTVHAYKRYGKDFWRSKGIQIFHPPL